MSYRHDVHGWMRGYPYECATPEEVRSFMVARGFHMVRSLPRPKKLVIFGTGCEEFVRAR